MKSFSVSGRTTRGESAAPATSSRRSRLDKRRPRLVWLRDLAFRSRRDDPSAARSRRHCSAHGRGGRARTAALFLILHGAAALGVAAHAAVSASRTLVGIGFVMEAGAAVFAADLATRAFTGARLFPFAAPIGGSAMILSWLALGGGVRVGGLEKRGRPQDRRRRCKGPSFIMNRAGQPGSGQ